MRAGSLHKWVCGGCALVIVPKRTLTKVILLRRVQREARVGHFPSYFAFKDGKSVCYCKDLLLQLLIALRVFQQRALPQDQTLPQ